MDHVDDAHMAARHSAAQRAPEATLDLGTHPLGVMHRRVGRRRRAGAAHPTSTKSARAAGQRPRSAAWCLANTVVARAQRHKHSDTRRRHERHPPPAPPSPLPPQTIVTTPTALGHILARAMRLPPSTLFTSFCRQPSNGMLGTLYTHAYTYSAHTC